MRGRLDGVDKSKAADDSGQEEARMISQDKSPELHRSPRSFVLALLLFSLGKLAWAGHSLGDAMAMVEQTLSRDPISAIAGPAATSRYAAGLAVTALNVYEQSRHLDKPHFATTGLIDGRPGLVNPDNIYASALLDEHGVYRIHGRRGNHVQLSFQILNAYPIVALGRNLIVVDLDRLGINPGDSFEIFLGGPRRAGYWIPMPAGARSVLVRQTFADWRNERPSSLSIERLDPGTAAVAETERDATAGDYLLRTLRCWNETYLPELGKLPVNHLPPPRPSDPAAGGLGGQQSVMTRFRLATNQALVITALKTTAPYQAIQLGDPWFVTPNFLDHQVSLNQTQATADSDGRIRYVISVQDPGVANWLDPAGFSEGYLFMRWQGLGRDLSPEEAPTATVVSMSELADRLPADTRHVTPAERAAQLAERLHAPIRSGPRAIE